jgi:hypothetical protein
MGAFAGLIFEALFIIVVVAVVVLSIAFWIWMLIDCLTKEPAQGNDKLIWFLVIFFGSLLGAEIYYFIRRPERMSAFGQ